MPDILPLILSQGPTGILAGLFIWLYLSERKKSEKQTKDHHREIEELRDKQYTQLDDVRKSQVLREQEISRTLEEYGSGVVSAVEKAAIVANELRRAYAQRQR